MWDRKSFEFRQSMSAIRKRPETILCPNNNIKNDNRQVRTSSHVQMDSRDVNEGIDHKNPKIQRSAPVQDIAPTPTVNSPPVRTDDQEQQRQQGGKMLTSNLSQLTHEQAIDNWYRTHSDRSRILKTTAQLGMGLGDTIDRTKPFISRPSNFSVPSVNNQIPVDANQQYNHQYHPSSFSHGESVDRRLTGAGRNRFYNSGYFQSNSLVDQRRKYKRRRRRKNKRFQAQQNPQTQNQNMTESYQLPINPYAESPLDPYRQNGW